MKIMDWVYKTAHVDSTCSDGRLFHRDLARVIDDFQEQGLTVEVQYQITANGSFAALVLGRKRAIFRKGWL